MKIIALTLFTLLTFYSYADERLVCATENQWPIKGQSGWNMELNFSQKTAFVTKAENAQTLRRYLYELDSIYGTEMTLTSPYGDQITLLAAEENNQFFAHHYYKNELKEEFIVTCYQSNILKNIDKRELAFHQKLKIEKQIKETSVQNIFRYISLENIPFPVLAHKLQFTISKMGDWEDTIVTEEQKNKIYIALGNDKNFKKLLTSINADLKKDSSLKNLGLLFGRDWYYGTGTVAFVLKYEEQVIVLPIEFGPEIKFNDERLDYVY